MVGMLLLLSGCAALKAGWAQVTWVEGKVSPAVSCATRINAEGDVEMICSALNSFEADLLWRREKQRTKPPGET